MTGETSGQTTNVITENNIGQIRDDWREHIREEAEFEFIEDWIFEEYTEYERYNFYYRDMDYNPRCLSVTDKDIKRMYLFLRKTEAEERFNKLKRDMR